MGADEKEIEKTPKTKKTRGDEGLTPTEIEKKRIDLARAKARAEEMERRARSRELHRGLR